MAKKKQKVTKEQREDLGVLIEKLEEQEKQDEDLAAADTAKIVKGLKKKTPKLSDKDRRIKALEDCYDIHVGDINALNEQIALLAEEKEHLRGDNDVLRRDLDRLREDLQSLKTENLEWNNRYCRATSELQDSKQQIDRLVSEKRDIITAAENAVTALRRYYEHRVSLVSCSLKHYIDSGCAEGADIGLQTAAPEKLLEKYRHDATARREERRRALNLKEPEKND